MKVFRMEFPGSFARGFAIIAADSPEQAKVIAATNCNSRTWGIDWDQAEQCEEIPSLTATEAGVCASFAYGE